MIPKYIKTSLTMISLSKNPNSEVGFEMREPLKSIRVLLQEHPEAVQYHERRSCNSIIFRHSITHLSISLVPCIRQKLTIIEILLQGFTITTVVTKVELQMMSPFVCFYHFYEVLKDCHRRDPCGGILQCVSRPALHS